MIIPAQLLRLNPPVEPFCERTTEFGLTYGVGPAGYDVRIAESLQLMPHTFYLASTLERFRMPKDWLAIVHDKSTWARRGISVQNTVIEPGWEGYLTMELTNHGSDRIVIQKGMAIAQIVFHELLEATEEPYNGKYQNQEAGPQPAR